MNSSRLGYRDKNTAIIAIHPDGAMTEKDLLRPEKHLALPKVHVGERFPLPHFRGHSARAA
jgi:hypothetical protein